MVNDTILPSDNPLRFRKNSPLLDYVSTKTRVEFKGSCLKQDKISFDHGGIVNIYIVFTIQNILIFISTNILHLIENDFFHLVIKLVKM